LVNVFELVIPEAILGAGACILFLGATFRLGRNLWAAVAFATLALAGLALAYSSSVTLTFPEVFAGPLLLDRLALLIKAVALASGAVFVLFSWNEIPHRQAAEYYACLLLIVAGLCLTGAANELVTLFLALELISIPTYVLLYLPRYDNA